MKQSRAMSLVEAIANVAVGYSVAVVTQIMVFPVFGLHTTLEQNLKMGAVFTLVSVVRSFVLRRFFEAIRIRATEPPLIRRRLPYRRDFSSVADRNQRSIR
ncbi:DUF7220 family protein [Ostreiculturibacter nitratireducens]|uniref:DUF7220 family protein n=1 Tax=Ostreiculturibacter nitratireducens TaxID=3075226 RepID=UPI003CCC8BFD